MAPYRKTRIVCVSDTHGYTPAEAGFSLPSGDVLIHAGDLSNRGTTSELERTFKWIEEADYEVKIVVAGNHDVTLDSNFYAEHGAHLHGDQAMDERARIIDLINKVKETTSIIFLSHESALIRLKRPDGPRTTFKVFGSPYSRFSGIWAFGCPPVPEDEDRLMRQIPLDTDILVTHTPPLGLCDRRSGKATTNDILRAGNSAYGSEQFLRTLSNIRPMLAVCGHVHEGRGYQRVMWTEGIGGRGAHVLTDIEPLPSMDSKKQSLIDLTGKKRPMLQNTSSCATLASESVQLATSGRDGDKSNRDFRNLRKETCIVNAAIMAKSWPYVGGKLFNRPIIVDINLPAWDFLEAT